MAKQAKATETSATETEADKRTRTVNYRVTDRINLRYHNDVADRIDLVAAVRAHFEAKGLHVTEVLNDTGTVTVTVESEDAYNARMAVNGPRLPRAFRGIFASPALTAKVQAMIDAGKTEDEITAALAKALG